MKRGIRAHDTRAVGLENICACCKKNGIEYIQLVLEKSINGFETGKFTQEYAESFKSQIGDTKIAILGSYINPSNPDDEQLKADIAKFKEKIKYASVLNPIAVGTETGIFKEGMTDSEEAYQRVLSTVRELVAEAEKYRVNIGIEGVHFFVINTPQKMKRLLDDVNSDNIKVIFDPVNYINSENYNSQDKLISDTFGLFGDKICVLHAKDFVVEDGNIVGTKPGEGLLNYKLILEKMREYGLDIPVICEEINETEAVEAFERISALNN